LENKQSKDLQMKDIVSEIKKGNPSPPKNFLFQSTEKKQCITIDGFLSMHYSCDSGLAGY
jgi:hypothetical protein